MSAFYRIVLLLSVAVAAVAAVGSVAAHGSQRERRSLLDLAGAIKCNTGRIALSYMMYGCYCGVGGQGWPRDKTDWCCFKHDCCYGDAEKRGCETKTKSYRWTCEDNAVECDDLDDMCDERVCECDRDFAKCLKRAAYILKNTFWPDMLCKEPKPTCNILQR
ncbi:phospholipase A2-like [Solea senegalensis]|uniref:Phospholipase A2-like n=1 Tax=Solea senegalensis TaxID=28829 RepID=A0AAV6RJT0_SOLSE|nr:group 10 secretory phospholipase A2 [Solea senegalensis]KAG7505673.1 phospholipase A2-like [Solea senegalensis]